jgi:hypothetical protein
MKLTDRSGGFWTDIIVRRKNANLALSSRIVPPIEVKEAIGQEIINSIKGSVKSSYSFNRNEDGSLVMVRVPKGTYQYGLAKGTDSNGRELAPLSPVTIIIREKVKNVSRKSAFILRETNQHIYDGLHIKFIAGSGNISGAHKIEIGWDGFDEELVRMNEQSRMVDNPLSLMNKNTGQSFKQVQVPGRKFRGFSEELKENIIAILSAWKNA